MKSTPRTPDGKTEKKPTPRTPDGMIDWKEVRRRLDKAVSATEETQHLSPKAGQEVMEERARKLARASSRDLQAASLLEVATFVLANEHYAIETHYVQKVVRLTEYTPVPGTPDFLVGVVNLRGDVLAVIDLRKFFGLPPRGLTDLSRVIVLGGDRPEVGVLA